MLCLILCVCLQLNIDRAKFLVQQAFEQDELNSKEEALELYTQAAELCLSLVCIIAMQFWGAIQVYYYYSIDMLVDQIYQLRNLVQDFCSTCNADYDEYTDCTPLPVGRWDARERTQAKKMQLLAHFAPNTASLLA